MASVTGVAIRHGATGPSQCERGNPIMSTAPTPPGLINSRQQSSKFPLRDSPLGVQERRGCGSSRKASLVALVAAVSTAGPACARDH